jgi:allatostatin receptor
VVLVVAANQQMRSTTNLLIINLAVADLLFIVFCVPFTATDYVLPFWPFGDVWCKIVQYLIVVTAYASVYTLVLMSLDRFMAVVHPIASMSVSIFLFNPFKTVSVIQDANSADILGIYGVLIPETEQFIETPPSFRFIICSSILACSLKLFLPSLRRMSLTSHNLLFTLIDHLQNPIFQMF